jgi:hypothetical protein
MPTAVPKSFTRMQTDLIEDREFDIVRAIYFDKKKYTLMMTELDESNNTGASIQYFECY